jgi:hypothetical protein
MKKIMFGILAIFMLLVTLISANALTEDYPLELGTTLDGNDFDLGTGDSAFYTDYSGTGNHQRTGDTNGDGVANIVTRSGNNIYIYNRTYGDLEIINLEETWRGHNLFDFTSDGVYEIIVVEDVPAVHGLVRVYQYVGGSYQLMNAGQNLSNRIAQFQNPICNGVLCYFVDHTGIVYEYHAVSNSFTDTHSTGYTIQDSTNLYIDDCTPYYSGNDLVVVNNGYYTIVDLNNMDFSITKSVPSGGIHSNFYCDNIGGSDYIFYTGWHHFVSGSACSVATWGNRVEWGYDEALANGTINDVYDDTYTMYSGTATGTPSVGCQASHDAGVSQPFMYDIDSDGTDDFCHIGAYSTGCGSGCKDNYRVYCVNMSNSAVLLDSDHSLATGSSSNINHDLGAYIIDYNGDTDEDFLIGHRYYEISSDTWNVVSGVSTGTDYYSFMKYGSDCISYYWDDDARVSTTFSCNYPTPTEPDGDGEEIELWSHKYRDETAHRTMEDAVGNTALLSTVTVPYYDATNNDMLVGDFDGDDYADYLTGKRFYTHDGNNTYNFTYPHSLSVSVFHDYDDDGLDELIVWYDTNISVYEYDGGIQHVHTSERPYSYRNHPACYDGYCYYVDTGLNVIKYDVSANSVVTSFGISANVESGTNFQTVIDECWSSNAGLEVMFTGTSQSYIIPVNNFQLSQMITAGGVPDPYSSHHTAGNYLCGQSGGESYMMGSKSGWTASGSCGSGYYQRSSVRIWKINSTGGTEYVANMLQTYDSADPSDHRHNVMGHFIDQDGDGDKEYCFWNSRYTSCSGSDRYTRWSCMNLTGTFTNLYQSYTGGSDPLNNNAVSYIADFDNDGGLETMAGNYILNLDGSGTGGGAPHDLNFGAFIDYGDECLTYAYSISPNTYFRVSSSPNCDYAVGGAEVPPSNVSENVLFEETFTTSSFFYDEQNCSDNGHLDYFDWSDRELTGQINWDNDWYCYTYNKSADAVLYQSSNSTYYNTQYGLKKTNIGLLDVYDVLSTFSTYGWDEFTVTQDNIFEFTCAQEPIYYGTDAYNYLVFSRDWEYDDPSAYPIAISLKDGGCDETSHILKHNVTMDDWLDTCCELYDIVGDDCDGTKSTYEFTLEELLDACPLAGELNFNSISRVDLWRFRETSGSSDISYIDDIKIYEEVILNNSLPYIIFNDPIPDPQNVSEVVSWSVSIGDADDPSGNIWSKFDCGDDGILDFNWGKRGVGISFDCAYSSTGNYTGTAWASDDAHYPTYFDMDTNVVEIIELEAEPQPPFGGNCIGFSAPSCTGSCYFYDDFSYSNPVDCNEWEGTANSVNPVSSMLQIYNMPVTLYDIEIDGNTYSGGTIYQSMYESFEVEFKIRVSHHSNIQFDILDEELDQYSAFLIISNYEAKVYDPSSTTIKTLTPDQWYEFKIEVDMVTDTIDWYVDDTLEYTGSFYDGATTSQRKFSLFWSSVLSDFDMDYFRITYGDLQENATLPTEEVTYTYDPSMFCAINWTTNISEDRWKPEYCEMRGYPTDQRISLCLPRACISDVGNALFNWATSNIFMTIIVVTAFILIAPLLIAGRKKLR